MTSSPHLDVVKKHPVLNLQAPLTCSAHCQKWRRQDESSRQGVSQGGHPEKISYGHEMPLRWWKWKCQEEWPSSGCCTCHRASGESWLAENWNHLINQPINQWLQVIALDQSKQILITMFNKNLSIEVSPKYGNVCVRACNEAYLGRFLHVSPSF